MRILGVLLFGTILLSSCTAGLPPGMSWDDYYSALHRLKHVYSADQVADCRELAQLYAETPESSMAVKDMIDDKAVRAGADTVYYEEISSRPNHDPFSRYGQIFSASAIAYRCR